MTPKSDAKISIFFILRRYFYDIFQFFRQTATIFLQEICISSHRGAIDCSMRDFVPLTILSGAIMAKFINPFTDVGFKIIFGQEMTKDLLIDFLNDLLVGERHIQDRCVLHEFPSG